MKVEFVASVSVVTADAAGSRRLFEEALGLPLEDRDGYLMSEKLDGVKHFGVWPLRDAARSCFGSETWPNGLAIPQASIEFEVARPDDVQAAAAELRAEGYELLHDAKEEPWGQTITRLLSPDGLIVGVSYTPWFH